MGETRDKDAENLSERMREEGEHEEVLGGEGKT